MNIQSPNSENNGKKENPAPFYIVAVPQKEVRDKIKYDNNKTGQGISAVDVSINGMPFNIEVGSYDFVEKDGQMYRVGEDGIEYPPISKEKFEKILKERNGKLKIKKQDPKKNADNERI